MNDCEIEHESKAPLHLHLLVLFPSLLCFSIILLSVPSSNAHSAPSLPYVSSFPHHLSVIRIPCPLSQDRTTESRPAKLMTIIILRNVAAGLALDPCCPPSLPDSQPLFLPPISFSCPSPKVAISHAVPRLQHLARRAGRRDGEERDRRHGERWN